MAGLSFLGTHTGFADPKTISRTDIAGGPNVYDKYVTVKVTQTISNSTCGKNMAMYLAETHNALPSGVQGAVWKFTAEKTGTNTFSYKLYKKLPTGTSYVVVLSAARTGCIPKDQWYWIAWEQVDNPSLFGGLAMGTGTQIGVGTIFNHHQAPAFKELFPTDAHLNTLEFYFSAGTVDFPLASAGTLNIVYKVCEAPAKKDCAVPHPPSHSCPIPEGMLVGWYEGKDFKQRVSGKYEWNDFSIYGNNLDENHFDGSGFIQSDNIASMLCIGGSALCKARNSVSVKGTKNDTVRLKSDVLPPLYTFFSLARYNLDASQPKKAIFGLHGSTIDFYSGFGPSGEEGYAKHGSTFITGPGSNRDKGLYKYDPNYVSGQYNGEWLLSVDQRSLYRGNGQYWMKNYPGGNIDLYRTLAVNPNKDTGYDVMELLVYKTELTIEQIKCVEYNYFGRKYSMIPLPQQCEEEYELFPKLVYQVTGGNGQFWNKTYKVAGKDDCKSAAAQSKVYGRKTLVQLVGECSSAANNNLYLGFQAGLTYNVFALSCGTNLLAINGTYGTSFAYPGCTYNANQLNYVQFRPTSKVLRQFSITNPNKDIPLNNASLGVTDDESSWTKMRVSSTNANGLPGGNSRILNILIEETWDDDNDPAWKAQGLTLRAGHTKFTIYKKTSEFVTCEYNGTFVNTSDLELLLGLHGGAGNTYRVDGYRAQPQCVNKYNISAITSGSSAHQWIMQLKAQESVGNKPALPKISTNTKLILSKKFWITMFIAATAFNLVLVLLIVMLFQNGAVPKALICLCGNSAYKVKGYESDEATSASETE